MKTSLESPKTVHYKKWLGWVLLTAMTLGILSGCSLSNKNEMPENKEQIVSNAGIVDGEGNTVIVEEEPQRIVSLSPSVTEIISYLGAENKLIGRTDYCNFPETIKDVVSVGDIYNPNLEAIIALEPDLVLASNFGSEEVMSKLKETGIKAVFLYEEESFEGTYAMIEKVGALIHKETEADTTIGQMKKIVEETVGKVAALKSDNRPLKVYYTMEFGEADYTAGGNTFIGDMIALAGGDNIAKDIEGWSISKEKIAEEDPDLIIMTSGRNMIENIKKDAFYKKLKAVKEDKLYEIDEDMISRQGPRIVDAFIALAKIINPELE